MAGLDTTFGMLLDGLVISTCLFGINVLQCYVYFRTYGRDHILLKATVATLLVLDTAGTIFAAHGTYGYLVTGWGDPSALERLDVGICIESLLTVFITFIVQCFFAHSIYSVSQKNRFITFFILFVSFAALVIGIVMSIEDIVQGTFEALAASRFKILAGLDLGLSALSDITITASLCYFLHYGKSGFKRTDTLLDKLIVYSLNRGILTFIVQALNAILFCTLQNLIWSPFHLCLSKVYTISLLATLNRRDRLLVNSRPEMISYDMSGSFLSDSSQIQKGIQMTESTTVREEISTEFSGSNLNLKSVSF